MALSNLYLFKYNNYHNKLLKREETLAGYGTPLVSLKQSQFNPNNYIATTHIFNTWVMDEKTVPDYCVVCNESDIIVSRWFVIGVKRTRGGQWQVQLLGDLAAEYKRELLSSTCFIEKGFTNSSPFVFNNENMGFNQILSDLITIENNLHTPWLVLYLARYKNAADDETNIQFNTFSGEFDDQPTTKETNYVLESLDKYQYYAYTNKGYTAYDEDQVFFGAVYTTPFIDPGTIPQQYDNYEMTQQRIPGESGFKPKGLFNKGVGDRTTSIRYPYFEDPTKLKGDSSATYWGLFSRGLYRELGGLLVNSYTANPVLLNQYGKEVGPAYVGTVDGFNELMGENGKTIKVGDDIYRIDVMQLNPPNAQYGSYKIQPESELGQEMKGSFFGYNGIDDIPSGTIQSYYVHFPLSYPILQINLVKIGLSDLIVSDPITYNIPYTKAITKDASYEIIAAPYLDTKFTNVPDQPGIFEHTGDVALQWFQNIINKYNGANFAYDLQLVPYCPVDSLDISTENVIYCQRGAAKLALAIQLDRSNFSKIYKPDKFPWNENRKLSNELDVYRLVSPNGVGEYEWSPSKNGGTIGVIPSFEVDCTLIPFNPYIKVNPYFKELYGKDFNDYRGLICSGDFSLPIVNSEWETYQLNNKYYQSIFDRNIEYQEFNNKYANIQDQINAVVGTASGAAQGAAAGGMAGGPLGAAIGGLAGGIASGVGGVADVLINQELRKENINYQKDQFGFELGTIKARSQSLTRTTSFNVNNKYFPYIEYYTCTEQEKQALQNKMKYNGMTIGVIGQIPDFLNPSGDLTYIQGTIIEIDISADAEITDRLNQILQGGIRLNNV